MLGLHTNLYEKMSPSETVQVNLKGSWSKQLSIPATKLQPVPIFVQQWFKEACYLKQKYVKVKWLKRWLLLATQTGPTLPTIENWIIGKHLVQEDIHANHKPFPEICLTLVEFPSALPKRSSSQPMRDPWDRMAKQDPASMQV